MTRLQLQRAAYGLAAPTALIGCGGGMVGFLQLMSRFGAGGHALPLFFYIPIGVAIALLVLLAGAFLYLAYKPRAWGPILCLVGAPWIMFTLMSGLMSQMGALKFGPLFLFPGVGGAMLLAIGALQFAVERRWLLKSET